MKSKLFFDGRMIVFEVSMYIILLSTLITGARPTFS